MKPSLTSLIRLKVKYGVKNNEMYFDVDEMREMFPDLRFPPDKICKVSIGGVEKDGIRHQDMRELTEFEKNIIKVYNNK